MTDTTHLHHLGDLLSADAQRKICSRPDDCFDDSKGYPTLYTLQNTYGDKVTLPFLTWFLVDLNEFCGCRDKMGERQLEQVAMMIITNYGYMSVTEVMMFFWWLKMGKYGVFYGNIDPMRIMSALMEFAQDRRTIRTRIANNQPVQDGNAISYDEYCRRHGKRVGYNPFEEIVNSLSNGVK